MRTRVEKDPLGELRVPLNAYYGVQTARAIENFPISGLKPHRVFVWASAAVKKATAKVNAELGLIKPKIGEAIIEAADEVMAGRLSDQFVVDVFQAGAGTSHHMNTNEVLANRAIEILGGMRGDYSLVHPNDHVNFGQSTNDVFPTTMRIACLKMYPNLIRVLDELRTDLDTRAKEFTHIIKSGRTHLQDAVPITLGQEFSGYAKAIEKSIKTIHSSADGLRELGIGGSAAGTGLNTYPQYRFRVVEVLRQLLGTELRPAENLFESMQSMAPFARFSSSLRGLALELIRIANDVRLLSSGPNTGFDEIWLPAVQPGSSIMPGKVNPVMAEMLNMVCFQVVGNDTTVAMATQAGQLELNVMMPVIIHNLLNSMEILTNAVTVFANRCVKGITANAEKCQLYFAQSLGLATVLNTLIGYSRAAEVMKEAFRTGKTVLQVVEEKKILSKDQIDNLFSAESLTKPGVPRVSNGSNLSSSEDIQ